MMAGVLIVDDEADIRVLIGAVLDDEGYDTRSAGNSDEALSELGNRLPDLVILDIWLHNSAMDGLELLEVIKRRYPQLPVVMISGHGTIETAVLAMKRGAYDFIEKPFKSERLLMIVSRAIEAARLRQENEELRHRAILETELIGTSSAVNHLRQAIEKVAPTGSRILITGPAGAGKEVVARQLHKRSKRAAGNFVALNCAILRPEHLEVELFGCEAGVEGVDSPSRVGTFEKAHQGTLLLDEVSDMPMETQGKIVRILQEQAFQRVGGDRRVEVDVRVAAATNRDLENLISEGRFREDLYYRLNVVPIEVPPLAERLEDIPALADHFMERAAQAAGRPRRCFASDAITVLQSHDWPGNVRQLRNIVDWILIMAPGGPDVPISAEMLPPDVTESGPQALGNLNSGTSVMTLPLREARGEFERQYLEAQVMRFGGNISRTASFVGMERSALHRKLRSLGINTADR
jgi:two-component system nitrogen regulation response regulator NtrX